MTNPSPPPAVDPGPPTDDQHGPRPSGHDLLDLGRLRRSNDDRRIVGVAAGLARHLDIDPIIVRVTLVVLVFFGGSGLLLYGAGWLLVPEEGSPAQPLGLDDRNRTIALMGTGILAALAAVGDVAGAFRFPWPLVIIGLLVVWFLNRRARPRELYYPPAPGQPVSTAVSGTGIPQTGPAPYQPYGQQTYQQTYAQPSYVRPRNPRKKGPILFWFTLALIAIGAGTLGLIQASGTSVPEPAYPALALALTGAMLVLGAFWGRGGGLMLLGLVLVAATLATIATKNYDKTTITYEPEDSAMVNESYRIDDGELILDLSGVKDVEGLDGRDLTIDGGVGEIEVIVPAGVDVTAAGNSGVGDVSVFGQHDDGFGVTVEGLLDGGTDVPDLSIYIDLGVGQVTIREQ